MMTMMTRTMMMMMMTMMIMDHIYIYILKVHRHGNSKIRNPFAIPARSNVNNMHRRCLNSVLAWFRSILGTLPNISQLQPGNNQFADSKRPAVVVPSLTRLLLSSHK
jgi:cellulose synthase/poly-beta-1,6-N-acetylglucosamine synthase-like glycosyltransferase